MTAFQVRGAPWVTTPLATLAIEQVKNRALKNFLTANADLISLPHDDLRQTPKNKDLIASGFVALADVPDIVWKNYPSPHLNRKGVDIGVVGGRDTQSSGMRSTGPEHPPTIIAMPICHSRAPPH